MGIIMEGVRINILLIEDDSVDVLLLSEHLSESTSLIFHLDRFEDLPGSMEDVKSLNPDIILLDLGLAHTQGLETLDALIDLVGFKYPILILTGNNDEEAGIEAIKKGAQDYLIKGYVNTDLLVRGIRYSIERHSLHKELENMLESVQEMDRMRMDFFSCLNHELRSPMTVINGFTDILLKGYAGELNKKQKDYISSIGNSSSHMLTLINDVLDYSQLESGKSTLNYTTFSISDIFDECKPLITSFKIRKNLDVSITVKDKGRMITADRIKLKQILFNLLSNAMKFTPACGNVSIMSGFKEDMLEVMIEDTGIGIPEDKISSVFDPFIQIGTIMDDSQKGTGLGLNLVKRYVQMHGGSIYLESEVGKGSRFTFTIPVNGSKEPDISEAVEKN